MGLCQDGRFPVIMSLIYVWIMQKMKSVMLIMFIRNQFCLINPSAEACLVLVFNLEVLLCCWESNRVLIFPGLVCWSKTFVIWFLQRTKASTVIHVDHVALLVRWLFFKRFMIPREGSCDTVIQLTNWLHAFAAVLLNMRMCSLQRWHWPSLNSLILPWLTLTFYVPERKKEGKSR